MVIHLDIFNGSDSRVVGVDFHRQVTPAHIGIQLNVGVEVHPSVEIGMDIEGMVHIHIRMHVEGVIHIDVCMRIEGMIHIRIGITAGKQRDGEEDTSENERGQVQRQHHKLPR